MMIVNSQCVENKCREKKRNKKIGDVNMKREKENFLFSRRRRHRLNQYADLTLSSLHSVLLTHKKRKQFSFFHK